MSTARFQAVAAPLPNGKVLIAGGIDVGFGGAPFASAELFDPATNTFSSAGLGAMSTARDDASASPLPNGEVLIAGGFDIDGNRLSNAELFESAPQTSAAGGGFGDQTVSQPSIADPVSVMNLGAQALAINGASLRGTNPGDFTITANACAGRTLAFEQSCTITVRFTPQAAGARSATLALQDNEPTPTSITLASTGVTANSRATGPQGHVGPPGPTGPQGPTGQVKLVSCKTMTKKVKQHGKLRRVARYSCTTRLISGIATFTTTGASVRARLSRGGVLYATGISAPSRTGRFELVLTQLRPFTHGQYVLTLITPPGRQSARHTIAIK